jgi:hypothetical protein
MGAIRVRNWSEVDDVYSSPDFEEPGAASGAITVNIVNESNDGAYMPYSRMRPFKIVKVDVCLVGRRD